jgi:hypothetical protein
LFKVNYLSRLSERGVQFSSVSDENITTVIPSDNPISDEKLEAIKDTISLQTRWTATIGAEGYGISPREITFNPKPTKTTYMEKLTNIGMSIPGLATAVFGLTKTIDLAKKVKEKFENARVKLIKFRSEGIKAFQDFKKIQKGSDNPSEFNKPISDHPILCFSLIPVSSFPPFANPSISCIACWISWMRTERFSFVKLDEIVILFSEEL